ncbi:putative polysaccharide biosynthesis protein [Pseudalkalibacillus caeni]|uniref:Polysaccharide biosynthesis protein n=1 Tax=Exobacillus caeni TaxID=2574798 RepID=A0A5R9EVP5_9BACL|nr:polysaccharide biosynthesis protein [Pseudalkalibacillus caeni]TLS35117.1 polysaccharide biosynthesis protein [Pseudalkalibacillus caeni]
MNASNNKSFWQGAVLLTAVALVMKVMSVGYRIPYQNLAGDLGFYVYQQVYPFYSIVIILATYGFPVVISRLVSDSNSKGDHLGAIDVARISFYSLAFIGLVSFAVLFSSAPYIAGLMGDRALSLPLRVTSFSFLVMPLIASVRGYFQGKENMFPTAASQLIEQAVRVIAILLLTLSIIKGGYGAYAAGTGAAAGSVIGGGAAVLFLLFYFLYRKKTINRETGNGKRKLSIKVVLIRLLKEGFAICVSALVLVLIQLVDALTIVPSLIEAGFDGRIARITKGVFDRGQPLIQLGTVLATSLSLSLVPVITKAYLKRDFETIIYYSSIALKVSVVIGVAAAAGLAIIIEPVNTMLFTDNARSLELGVLGVSLLFSSIALTAAGILQGMDAAREVAWYVVLLIGLKVLLNLSLVPAFGLMGAAFSTVGVFSLFAFLSVLSIHKKTGLFYKAKFKGIKVFASMAAMIIVVGIWKETLYVISGEEDRMSAAVIAVSSSCIGAVSYLLALLRLHVFNDEELLLLPKGDKLLSFSRLVRREKAET